MTLKLFVYCDNCEAYMGMLDTDSHEGAQQYLAEPLQRDGTRFCLGKHCVEDRLRAEEKPK